MAEVVALFGGTFDPVHRAHLACALAVSRLFRCSPVHLLPNAIPPHRPQPEASGIQRLTMLRLACAPYPQLHVDDWELRQSGPSWTLHTLRHFRARSPEAPLVLVIGADSLANLDSWHRWREYAGLCHLAVLPRPGARPPSFKVTLQFPPARRNALMRQRSGLRLMLQAPQLDISASAVRRELESEGRSAALSPAVRDYIRRHHLYNDSGPQPATRG